MRDLKPAWIGYGGTVLSLHVLGLLGLLQAARTHPMYLGMG